MLMCQHKGGDTILERELQCIVAFKFGQNPHTHTVCTYLLHICFRSIDVLICLLCILCCFFCFSPLSLKAFFTLSNTHTFTVLAIHYFKETSEEKKLLVLNYNILQLEHLHDKHCVL